MSDPVTILLMVPASPVARVGYIIVHDTLCHGMIPAEWDGDDRPVLYSTRDEAEAERVDAIEMRTDEGDEAPEDAEYLDDDTWVDIAVVHVDGTLTLPELRRTFTSEALRALLRPS
jgi:hypothetical protein